MIQASKITIAMLSSQAMCNLKFDWSLPRSQQFPKKEKEKIDSVYFAKKPISHTISFSRCIASSN